MTFIATFYSHFGAVRFKRNCESLGIPVITMPVPRDLSSSCGTCARFEAKELPDYEQHKDELEKIVQVTDNGYVIIYESNEE